MIQRCSLRNVERLEKFWHNLISEQKLAWGTNVNGAVVAYYPEIPIYPFNHAAGINVDKDEAESLLNKVTDYFSSRRVPFVCFRISPLTRPRSFTSFLENHGFERKMDNSVMVFKRKKMENKLNPEVTVKEISESEIDLFDKSLLTIFEMPIEWKEGFDRVMLERKRKGGKFYLAYVEGKPVGICFLLSSMKTGGIFGVGTLKEYRRKGIGTALSLHAVMDSINEGNDLHTLQTEKGGYAERLYQKMGFEIDHTISYFVKEL
jgi:ribosomal protein S18 acetylase RimI-like enzyme